MPKHLSCFIGLVMEAEDFCVCVACMCSVCVACMCSVCGVCTVYVCTQDIFMVLSCVVFVGE